MADIGQFFLETRLHSFAFLGGLDDNETLRGSILICTDFASFEIPVLEVSVTSKEEIDQYNGIIVALFTI